jgi:SAM-dependent methyltransferase
MNMFLNTTAPKESSKEHFPFTESAFLRERMAYWDEYAETLDQWEGPRRYYRGRLSEIYGVMIPPRMRVLDLGCGTGDLLSSLEPSYGVGIDFSGNMLRTAKQRHPGLKFVQLDVHKLDLQEQFDYIICSDLVNELWDVQRVFKAIRKHCHLSTRVILNAYSHLWEGPRHVAQWLGLAKRQLPKNWLTVEDISNLLYLADIEVIRRSQEILWPFRTPLIDVMCNRYLVRVSPFRWFAMTNFIVARPHPIDRTGTEPVVTIVVPARNEAGNIRHILDRIPEMGGGTELIFVEGNSKDDTYGVIQREIESRPNCSAKLLKQTGTGKGDAVRLGFKMAKGEVLGILDADLTVPPEDLPRFYDAWRSGKGDLVNGVRLVYPMEPRAMRFFNLLGNKFFSLAFSWLLGQEIKDTLCGTKFISRRDYDIISTNRGYFGDLDPFGDFDLIFGSAKYTLKIVDLPVRYGERTYGDTNIQRWSHGWLLLKMLLRAMRKLKFV